jgi:hypothetical protein
MLDRLARLAKLLVVAALLTTSAAVQAHHGNSAYDETRTIVVTGVATEFDFVNPHTQIYMDVKNDKGEIVHWSVECNSPGIMRRSGWTRDTVKPGDQISVTLNPAKTGAPVGFSGGRTGQVVLASGQTLSMSPK